MGPSKPSSRNDEPEPGKAKELIAENKRTKATYLDLNNCGLTTLPAEVGEMVWLRKLHLSNNHELVDVTPLVGLPDLQELNLAWTQVSDLAPLAGLHALQQLDAWATQVSDLAPLAGLTALQVLIVPETEIADLAPLAGLHTLQHLHVFNTQVSDLAPLGRLVALQQLLAWKTQVSDLAPLAGLHDLQTLSVEDTKITDLAPLAGLTALQTLDVHNTQISDVTPLGRLVALQTLDFSFTQVTDLSPLTSLIRRGIPVKWSTPEMKGEAGIYVGGCPLVNPPPEIVRQGNEAILNHFTKPSAGGGVDHLSETKMRSPVSADWLDRTTIDRFSERMWALLNRAEQIRSSQNRSAVSTLHLVIAFAEQPDGQLSTLMKQAGVDLSSIVSLAADGGDSDDDPEGQSKNLTSHAGRRFPRITRDARLSFVKARDKADETGSAIIDDSHLLFGLLSLSGTDNLLIQGLNRQGITADKITLPMLSQIGPSTHVARDRWTVQDSLGYFPYAYAIYRFLTDKNTAPPLAISIQAPWGGGKTSMMRMIQAQLDPDAQKSGPQTPSVTKSATVKDVNTELDQLSEVEAIGKDSNRENLSNEELVQVPPIRGRGERRVTIWFNAWKYESTAQVWAGMADSIVHQISDRLGPIEKEKFWFRLQLRRIDAAKVRRKIHEQVLARFWEKLPRILWAYLLGPAIAVSVAIVGRISQHPRWESVGWSGTALTTIGSLFAVSKLWKGTATELEKQPARLSLGELVEAPDYGANLGFVHHVVNDLKRVFALIPTKYRPMVVFIDDLDRCSPTKVSEVIEAVNLFLAGEFPDCMFVLGIDDEMVAAALDKAHSDVISKLPSYAKSASIGWRFMDKFIQLPFLVPPPTPDELKKYAESLLSEDSAEPPKVDIETRSQAAQVVEASGNTQAPQQVVQEVTQGKSLSPKQLKALQDEVQVIQRMDENIRAFSDEEKTIRVLLSTSAAEFSTNPRDIKRFVNVFRFYYFLRAAREARSDPVPSLKQLSRWILFSLKWPEAVRYLSRSQLSAAAVSHPQFEALENSAKNCESQDEWLERAAEALGMKAEANSWLSNQEMMRFFRSEAELPQRERLSASYGKGLW